jgi:hypothetical protein
VAGELVHDLANVVAALDARARLAAGEGRLGRLPLAELDRVAETTGEMAAMLRDVLDVMRGSALSPEVTMDVREVAERTVCRILPALRPLEVRVAATLPPGIRVPGRASFLSRALTNLLRNASRHARTEVRVTLTAERRGGRPAVLVAVEDDGAGFPSPSPLPPRRRRSDAAPPHEPPGHGMGLSAVAWAVEQLGGTVTRGASADLGGARVDLSLPAEMAAAPASAGGRTRVLVLEDGGELAGELWPYLHARHAELLDVDSPLDGDEQLLYAVLRARPDALLLDPEVGGGRGVQLWETLHRLAPSMAARAIFLSALPEEHRLVRAARRTGRPVLLLPTDFAAVGDALDSLDAPDANGVNTDESSGPDRAGGPPPPPSAGGGRAGDGERTDPEPDIT